MERCSTHIQINILGIKINFLRPELYRMRRKYKRYKNTTDIPPADGNLRLIQLTSFAILKEFDVFARENNLQYWLDFGSLLGAIRHKGFIPWDDDIDLGMPRADYDRLYQMSKEDCLENISVVPTFGYRECCFLRLRHKKMPAMFVDIFPYDFFYKELDNEQKLLESQNLEKVLQANSKIIHSNTSFSDIENQVKKVTCNKILHNKEQVSEKPAIFMGIDFPHQWKNKFYDWDDIFPLSKIYFEGDIFLCPNKPKKVLESIYGDFWKLPKDLSPKHTYISSFSKEEKEEIVKIIKGL